MPKVMGCSKSSDKREVYSDKCLHFIKAQINSLTLQTKPKVIRRKETTKIRVEINKLNRKAIEKINKTKSCFFKKINKTA